MEKRVFEKIMVGSKKWNICVVSGNVRGVPNRNYIEQIRRTFVLKRSCRNYVVSHTNDLVVKIQNLVLGIVSPLMNRVLLQ